MTGRSVRKQGAPAHRIAIVGTVGVPGQYGGFETLADNLVQYHESTGREEAITVYCSGGGFEARSASYRTARLEYIDLEANGAQSILYDAASIAHALWRKHDRILLLGVSGAWVLPVARLFGRARFITNIDGIEWKREKWGRVTKAVLRTLEWLSVRFSQVVISDNQAIADYVFERYGVSSRVIPYGGDHATSAIVETPGCPDCPEAFALALCRIEPENNVATILAAFDVTNMPLVFVGNWDRSEYGRALKSKYGDRPNITLLDPVYEPSKLRAIRDRASLYIHGHSAGGTNPSLVEMMHFGIPVVAFDCSFNRHSTDDRAIYFCDAGDLSLAIRSFDPHRAQPVAEAMLKIAQERYTWAEVGKAYFDLFGD